jgi:hypothetical protein
VRREVGFRVGEGGCSADISSSFARITESFGSKKADANDKIHPWIVLLNLRVLTGKKIRKKRMTKHCLVKNMC